MGAKHENIRKIKENVASSLLISLCANYLVKYDTYIFTLQVIIHQLKGCATRRIATMANILIVNENPSVSAQLQVFLERIGHNVAATPTSTPEAMTWIENTKPDIVYIDIAFGVGHNSTEFSQIAKIALEEQKTRLILMVGAANKNIARLAKQINPDSYLTMPFSDQSVYSSLSVAFNPTQEAQIPYILQSALEQTKGQVWNEIPEEALSKVYVYVRANLEKETTLKTMARHIGMSESNFSRRFKASTGITPYQYVLQERLETAKYMLRQRDLSLAHIASATGFSSQSHFSTVFKRSTNKTPMKYRRHQF